VLFRGEDLDAGQVSAGLDQNAQRPVVNFAFKDGAKDHCAAYTAQNMGKYLTITLDGKVMESALIQSRITGPGEISSNMTKAQATALAAQLSSGELPLMMTLVNVEPVSPTTK
jgi:preprotein translocase subunit SecD